MSIFDRVRSAFGGHPDERKSGTAYNTQRTGVKGRAQFPDTDIDSLLRNYKRSDIVYAAIRAKADAAIDPRLIVQERSRDGEWSEIEGHPMRRLMMRPNPSMDQAAFMQAAIVSLDTAGVFYAEKVRATKTGPVTALYPLDPSKIAPIPGDDGIEAYEFKDGNVKVIIPAENMLVRRLYDPTSAYHGLSPLAVAMGTVDADNAQTDFIRSFFNNGGVPAGILKVKGELDEEQNNDIKRQWSDKYGRKTGRQHELAVLDDNAEYQKIGSGLDELDNETLRQFTESRVCMVFGVPPLVIYAYVGLLRSTYSNLKEARKGFWESTLTPMFKQWQIFFTWSLLTEFIDEELIFGERYRLHWDMSNVAALQDDVDAIQKRARDNWLAGGSTRAEYRAAIGEKPDDANDNFYLLPSGRTPQATGTNPTTPAAPADDPEPAPEPGSQES